MKDRVDRQIRYWVRVINDKIGSIGVGEKIGSTLGIEKIGRLGRG